MHHTKDVQITFANSAQMNGVIPLYLSDKTGRKLCAVWGTKEQREANASLWANSPQMYDLLKRAMKETKDFDLQCEISTLLGDIDGVEA